MPWGEAWQVGHYQRLAHAERSRLGCMCTAVSKYSGEPGRVWPVSRTCPGAGRTGCRGCARNAGSRRASRIDRRVRAGRACRAVPPGQTCGGRPHSLAGAHEAADNLVQATTVLMTEDFVLCMRSASDGKGTAALNSVCCAFIKSDTSALAPDRANHFSNNRCMEPDQKSMQPFTSRRGHARRGAARTAGCRPFCRIGAWWRRRP